MAAVRLIYAKPFEFQLRLVVLSYASFSAMDHPVQALHLGLLTQTKLCATLVVLWLFCWTIHVMKIQVCNSLMENCFLLRPYGAEFLLGNLGLEQFIFQVKPLRWESARGIRSNLKSLPFGKLTGRNGKPPF